MDDVSIALLRGVNVGGRNKLPMKELAAVVETIGGRDVKTLIQSGNVVFVASSAVRRQATTAIAREIERRFGISTPVVLRTLEELRRVVEGNPFLAAGRDEQMLHVAFLADRPHDDAVAALDPNRSPPDEFDVRGTEIYLWCPEGLARTKLTNAYFDSRLKTTCTVRNWRTTLKLLELAETRAATRST